MPKLKMFINGAWKTIATRFPADISDNISNAFKYVKKIVADSVEEPIVNDDKTVASFSYSNPNFITEDDSQLDANDSGIVGGTTSVIVKIPLSLFGDAKPSDVTDGVTFTSSAGIKMVGIKSDSGDSTDSMALLKNVYDDGEYGLVEVGDQKTAVVIAGPDVDSYLKAGTNVTVRILNSKFGTAKPEDVTKGVTFTSSSGLRIEGTSEKTSGITKKYTNTYGDNTNSIVFNSVAHEPSMFTVVDDISGNVLVTDDSTQTITSVTMNDVNGVSATVLSRKKMTILNSTSYYASSSNVKCTTEFNSVDGTFTIVATSGTFASGHKYVMTYNYD